MTDQEIESALKEASKGLVVFKAMPDGCGIVDMADANGLLADLAQAVGLRC